jgi:hypothetical protein
MASDIPAKSLRERAMDEFKEMAVLSAYFFVIFAAINAMKVAVLHDYGIELSDWGVAVVKALVLAKFVLLGKMMKIGERQSDRPLIVPTMRKTLIFLVLLIVLSIIEEILKGYIHGHSIGQSLGDLFGKRLAETSAGILILLLVLIPYFAFEELAEALGEARLVRAFLVDRKAAEPR